MEDHQETLGISSADDPIYEVKATTPVEFEESEKSGSKES